MKIVIVGAGGVGGYFGGRLLEAGEDVHFIARGDHLRAMKTSGLKILSPLGDMHLRDLNCSQNPEDIGPSDIVLICVKLWATDDAISLLPPLLKSSTAVISLQNGVVAVETLLNNLDASHVVGGVSRIAALIEESGVIRHNGKMASLTFGELDGKKSQRTSDFLAACHNAKVNANISDDINTSIWEKFVQLVTMSSITALTRLPIGPNREDPDTKAVMTEIMEEVIKVGLQKGAKLPNNMLEQQLENIDKLPATMVASMCGDLRRHSKLELPWFAGKVVELGKQLGVSTPANQFIYAALKHHKDGRHPMLQT